MQYDLFSAGSSLPGTTLPTPVDLRTTALPSLAEAAAQVGHPAQWAQLTLRQVLTKWEDLYADFIGILDAPIAYAKGFCKGREEPPEHGGPLAHAFYRREHARLVQGQQQLRAAVEGWFSENLEHAIEQGLTRLREAGLDAEQVEDSRDFFNDVIQRPGSVDLDKLLPVLMADLAQEYLRLEAVEATE